MNSNTIPCLRICALSFFTETLALVFVFHSTFDVGRSMLDVHLLICSTFIISKKPSTQSFRRKKQLRDYGVMDGEIAVFLAGRGRGPRRFLRCSISYKIASRFYELRGFAPIGIVEWWNIGMMGFRKMGGCLRVENHFGKEFEMENML